jgi:SAM-dependent methyltransferase
MTTTLQEPRLPLPRPTPGQRLIELLHAVFQRRCGYFEAMLKSPDEVFEYAVRSGEVVYQQFHGCNDFGGRTVVDLGCGPGGKTVYYATRGAGRTIGVDFDPKPERALAYARRKGLEVEFQSFGAGGRIDLPDDAVDVVINSSVLEHVVDLDATLGEVRRVLKPGGLLLSRWHPWRTRYGGHLDTMISVPFAHLVFSERDLVRSFYRLGVKRFGRFPRVCGTFHPHSTSLADLNFEYNRKTLRQMRRIVTAAGFEVRVRRYLWGKNEIRWPAWLPERLRDFVIDYEVLICANRKAPRA